ncbi:MAG: AEC family transporter [Desulfobacterales bacterium]
MVVESLFPVFALLTLGAALKHYGLTTPSFLATSDRLVYFIFFPALLFWKIGAGSASMADHGGYLLAAACAVLSVHLLSTLFILWRVPPFQAGSFSQSCYRFNTYIGMAVVLGAFGEPGVRYFGILIGFLIPLINVLAVSTLIWFSGNAYSARQRFRMTARALVSNPLIIACAAGLAYAGLIGEFPVYIENFFRLSASITLPLALLSIGGSLTLSGAKGNLGLSTAAALFKLVVLPLAGWGFLRLFSVEALPFKVCLVFFALPASTAIYVLSAQLNSDTQLASAAIVLSTLLSAVSLTIVLTTL